jgi:hypothetical protein
MPLQRHPSSTMQQPLGAAATSFLERQRVLLLLLLL